MRRLEMTQVDDEYNCRSMRIESRILKLSQIYCRGNRDFSDAELIVASSVFGRFIKEMSGLMEVRNCLAKSGRPG